MISREQMEPERGEYVARPVAAQLEQIATALDRIVAAIGEAAALGSARDDVDRCMAYTEWTAYALDGNPLVETVAECHRLMGRLRGEWSKIEASEELRGWVRHDVADMRDRLRFTARAAA
jgi:hypothetical protein